MVNQRPARAQARVPKGLDPSHERGGEAARDGEGDPCWPRTCAVVRWGRAEGRSGCGWLGADARLWAIGLHSRDLCGLPRGRVRPGRLQASLPPLPRRWRRLGAISPRHRCTRSSSRTSHGRTSNLTERQPPLLPFLSPAPSLHPTANARLRHPPHALVRLRG